jgi:hypothetical protein
MHGEAESESHAGRWALGVAAALMAYVLSVGPVVTVMNRSPASKSVGAFIIIAYYPLVWMSDRSSWVNRGMTAYCDWWEKIIPEGTTTPP